jgi:hypothetical protein
MDGADSMTITVADLERFFSSVQRLKAAEEYRAPALACLEEFLRHARVLSAEIRTRRAQTAERFSVFEAMAVGDSELLHSRFFAYLLNPHEHHDQGMLFLRSFLVRAGLAEWVPPEDEPAILVQTEYPIPEGRIDIAMFLGDAGTVCIENKVWAPEQNDQVGRYQRWLASTAGGAARKCIVFLTPDGRGPWSALQAENGVRIQPLSYRDIAAWLRELQSAVPPPLGITFGMYIRLCEQIGATAGSRESPIGGTKGVDA